MAERQWHGQGRGHDARLAEERDQRSRDRSSRAFDISLQRRKPEDDAPARRGDDSAKPGHGKGSDAKLIDAAYSQALALSVIAAQNDMQARDALAAKLAEIAPKIAELQGRIVLLGVGARVTLEAKDLEETSIITRYNRGFEAGVRGINNLLEDTRGTILSIAQLILDLHSGRVKLAENNGQGGEKIADGEHLPIHLQRAILRFVDYVEWAYGPEQRQRMLTAGGTAIDASAFLDFSPRVLADLSERLDALEQRRAALFASVRLNYENARTKIATQLESRTRAPDLMNELGPLLRQRSELAKQMDLITRNTSERSRAIESARRVALRTDDLGVAKFWEIVQRNTGLVRPGLSGQ